MPFFDVNRGLKGAGTGMMVAGPWGALAGGVLGGLGVFGKDHRQFKVGLKHDMPTSFGQAPERGAQTAYNAPDNPVNNMMGAPSLRPFSAPQMAGPMGGPKLITDGAPYPGGGGGNYKPMPSRLGAPQAAMPSQPRAFQNGSATLGLANPTYYRQSMQQRPVPMLPPGAGFGGQQPRTNSVMPINVTDTYTNQGGGAQQPRLNNWIGDAWSGYFGSYGPNHPSGQTDLGAGNVNPTIQTIHNGNKYK